MNAGDLDREITVQTATTTQSDSGEETYDWANATEDTISAQWLPSGTVEAWRAQQRLGAYIEGVFHVYDLDTRPTPESSRVVFEGRTFDLKGVTEIGRREGLELAVVARAEAV